jgi:hypothetical protein
MYNGFILRDAGIENTSFNQDSSNATKLVFMVPFENELKMSVLLRKLESFPDIIVAIEITSLEDAYLKIVKAETPAFAKDDERI